MIKLKIKAKDGSTWEINCDSQQKAEIEKNKIAVSGIYGLPGEYEIQIEDVTAQIEAEKNLKLAKETEKQARKSARKALDWSKINTVAELKVIVKNLVDEAEG